MKVPTPSILSAIKKLKDLLTREEKLKWLGMVSFALCTSTLEVLTASVIVVFAQVLNQPQVGQKYLSKVGIFGDLSPGRTLFYIAVICGIIYFLKNLFAAAEVFYQNFSIQKMNYHFKNKLLRRYAQADYEFYMTRNSSLGVAVVGGDADTIFSTGMIALSSVLSETVVFLFLISMIVYINPFLAIIIFGLGSFLGFIITKIVLPKFYFWGRKLQETALYSGQNLLQFFHGFKEIVLLGKSEFFINAYKRHSYKKSRVQALQTATNSLPRMVIEVLFVGLFVITIAFLCLEADNPAQMTGILGGYLYAGFRLMPGLNRIINQLNTFKSVIPSVERVYNEYHTVSEKENYIDVPELSFNKCISLSNLSFRYPNTTKEALSDINIEIKKGECIGIIGETGSGKSTLVDVILGLLKPLKGEILIDSIYPPNSYQWHKKIGYVPQSIYLIDNTIESNIAFGEQEIDETKLHEAIDAAQLRRFIDQLTQGVKTIVGERGIRLSGGERQRIAIARALYHNPEVLIFDEATSALDNETEAKLMETINKISKNRTVIMIAHRLTTLKNCNRIVTMEKGKIEEIVPYHTLKSSSV